MTCSLAAVTLLAAASIAQTPELRVGMIGLDTSHAVAFTRLMNAADAEGPLAGVRIVAGYPGGTDVEYSWTRVDGYTRELERLGVEIVDSIPALLAKVDCVMLMSVDGRPHLAQAEPVLRAGKRLFIDKPLAGSLRDALAIDALARELGVPWFSSSSLRFGVEPADIGDVTGCDAWSPCSLEPSHPDLFWYGIHGVETLFTVMGPGCKAVSCTKTDAAHVAVGRWRDGRLGTFRGMRRGKAGYGATVHGTNGTGQRGPYRGYQGLVTEIARFFRTGSPPVSAAETLEIYAFMAAADESLRRGGAAVDLASVIETARTPPATVRPNILFCIADDWSWPHAGAYGDAVVQTPAFDRIAAEGVLFTQAFCASPSCTPSRAGILSGQAVHRLREGANLHGFLPKDIAVYPDLLEAAGYVVGYTGKGWGPGRIEPAGRDRNPAGPRFKSFDAFLETVPSERPFCFWYGSTDPHRGYRKGSGAESGMDLERVEVPPFLPDLPEVRSDIADYYYEVQRFDDQVGRLLDRLQRSGRAEDTIVVVTSDNGMPFPRAKANLYDAGTRMPLAIHWPRRLRGGHTSRAFVSATDFAPTFLAAAGVEVPAAMTGRSLLPLLFTGSVEGRREIFLERERHAHVRANNVGYPIRAVRDERWLFLINFTPDRWPAGDPEHVFSVGPYGDCDDGPTKQAMLARPESREFALAFAKRPKHELYDLANDPWQVRDVSEDPAQEGVRRALLRRLERWMDATGDPRALEAGDAFERYPYYGGASGGPRKK